MTATILKLDTPTAETGLIYPRAVVEAALAKLRQPVLGHLGMNDGTDLTTVSHRVDNLRIEGNELLGDVTIFSTSKGEVLRHLDQIAYRVSGIGTLKGDVVGDYQLEAINAIHDR